MPVLQEHGTDEGSLAELKVALVQRERELAEALAQQAATAEVLKTISRETFDLPAVLDRLIASACRLCDADIGTIRCEAGSGYRLAATFGCRPEWREHFAGYTSKPDHTSVFGQTILKSKTVHIPDVLEDKDYGRPEAQKLMGLRAALGVPLIREGRVFGVVNLFRTSPRPFNQKQIELAETFSDQAVIAIENVRLFEAEQQRSTELAESLSQQTATADVLKVISRSTFDLQSVLDTLTESATKLCQADKGVIFLRDGDVYRLRANYGYSPEAVEYSVDRPMLANRDSATGRAALEGRPVHVPDVLADPEYRASGYQQAFGYRTVVSVPLLREGTTIGVFSLIRDEVDPFTDKQIELTSTFADQAVIAIENVRLFEAEQSRTRELTESLEQQTATSEVLRVISGSPTDAQPVFDMIAESVWRLCDAQYCFVYRFDGELLHFIAHHGLTPEVLEMNTRIYPLPPSRKSAAARAVLERKVVQIPDVKADPEFILGPMASVGGFGSVVGVPILRDGVPLGSMALTRVQTGLLPERQIELLKTFAEQAVIAIENARLFSELRESLEQQTATSEVLKVISSSPGALEPVFRAMLENATRICDAKIGILWGFDDGAYKAISMIGISPAYAEYLNGGPFRPGPTTGLGRIVTEQQTVQILDTLAEQAYADRDPFRVATAELGRARTLLNVPMFKEGNLIGAISIYRQEVRPFTEKQIELVTNFASQAVIAIENARLLNELRQRTGDLTESLEQQTATSKVLEVISSSPGDLAPVFDSILDNAVRICGARFANLVLYDGTNLRVSAMHNAPPEFEKIRKENPVVPLKGSAVATLVETKQRFHVLDLAAMPEFAKSPLITAARARSMLAVPMLKEGEFVGAINIYRQEVKPFSDKQIALLENFAAQAVIAIENARLLNELRQRTDDLTESLEQQTATSEVLQVISGSGGELQPVFETLLKNATRLCSAKFGNLYLYDGNAFRTTAMHNVPSAFAEERKRNPIIYPEPESLLQRVRDTKVTIHVEDVTREAGYLNRMPRYVSAVELGGFLSILAVPMLKDGNLVGVIIIYRKEVSRFNDKQVALVENFASQAVIAIENTRLLNELRQRTDDLSESLEYQTATSEILTVISRSPTDAQPVFDIIGERAEKLCDADVSVVSMVDGELIQLASIHGVSREGVEAVRGVYPLSLDRETVTARTVRAAGVVHAPDVLADAAYDTKAIARTAGYRACLGVPMMRDGHVIGTIFVGRREARPYNDNQIQLLKTFADQAVIAIENVRLFDEVEARTEDLQESLAQQTATADVLKVISRSTFDLRTVLDTLVESAARLCGAPHGLIFRFDGTSLRAVAAFNNVPGFKELWAGNPILPNRGTVTGRALVERRVIHIPDVLSDPEYAPPEGALKTAQKVGQYRTVLGVPMLREGMPLGTIVLWKTRVDPFTDKQIELVTTFADQAVIAIENVRLFDEVQARTEDLQESLAQQTATADVLKIISRATFDLQTVLDTLAESAAKLCEADAVGIHRPVGDAYPYVASYGFSQDYKQFMHAHPIKPGRGSVLGRAVLGGETVHVVDVEQDRDYTLTDAQKIGGWHSVLGVPLMREGTPIGVIMLTRNQVRPFSDKQIALATTFADQAVIAIENVRLLSEIQEKSHQLEEASKHKSQFLANMSHELRTPLNAILGYTELISDNVYGEIPDKVQATVQRIISNGKHLLGLINDVLDLSKIEAGQLTLSLSDYAMKDVVYNVYGAVEPLAAEKKLKFKADIAPDLPQGHGDERRLTQVLLNLVGNAIKFTDAGSVTIKAGLKDGMFSVAVLDTGPGISEEDQKKLFQEFQQADSSTTKKKGGTGLGLAISKRIIEMHGGRVWLESKLGEGSTFTFMVPVRAERTKRAS